MRRRWDYFHARHPWRAALITTAVFLPFVIPIAVRSGWIAVTAVLAMSVFTVIDALSWGPEGERRRRFMRKYGPLPEWREARWMREGSSWPYSDA